MLAEFLAHARPLLPSDGATIVVAVSGGADSVALLDLLAAAGRWPLVAFHLDHGLRAESAADADAVRALVDEIQIASGAGRAVAVVERADIADLARRWRCGIEEAGRRYRYERLRAVARETGASAIATAHHRDDQAETVLMSLLRGAGSAGGTGMPATRDLEGLPLVRPLLPFTRARLRAYLAERSVSWREDASNADVRFRRNHIRARVLPLLEAAVPGTVDALLRHALARHAPRGDASSRRPAAGERWRELLVGLGIEPSRQRIRRLEELEVGAVGRRLRLGPWMFERARDGVRWERETSEPSVEVVAIEGPGSYRRGGQRLILQSSLAPSDPRAAAGEAWLDAASIHWPLTWRPWRMDDAWRPLGSPGHQGVRKYLSDHRVDARTRAEVAVVADAEGVVWIPGFCIAERTRVSVATARCLHGQVGMDDHPSSIVRGSSSDNGEAVRPTPRDL